MKHKLTMKTVSILLALGMILSSPGISGLTMYVYAEEADTAETIDATMNTEETSGDEERSDDFSVGEGVTDSQSGQNTSDEAESGDTVTDPDTDQTDETDQTENPNVDEVDETNEEDPQEDTDNGTDLDADTMEESFKQVEVNTASDPATETDTCLLYEEYTNELLASGSELADVLDYLSENGDRDKYYNIIITKDYSCVEAVTFCNAKAITLKPEGANKNISLGEITLQTDVIIQDFTGGSGDKSFVTGAIKANGHKLTVSSSRPVKLGSMTSGDLTLTSAVVWLCGDTYELNNVRIGGDVYGSAENKDRLLIKTPNTLSIADLYLLSNAIFEVENPDCSVTVKDIAGADPNSKKGTNELNIYKNKVTITGTVRNSASKPILVYADHELAESWGENDTIFLLGENATVDEGSLALKEEAVAQRYYLSVEDRRVVYKLPAAPAFTLTYGGITEPEGFDSLDEALARITELNKAGNDYTITLPDVEEITFGDIAFPAAARSISLKAPENMSEWIEATAGNITASNDIYIDGILLTANSLQAKKGIYLLGEAELELSENTDNSVKTLQLTEETCVYLALNANLTVEDLRLTGDAEIDLYEKAALTVKNLQVSGINYIANRADAEGNLTPVTITGKTTGDGQVRLSIHAKNWEPIPWKEFTEAVLVSNTADLSLFQAEQKGEDHYCLYRDGSDIKIAEASLKVVYENAEEEEYEAYFAGWNEATEYITHLAQTDQEYEVYLIKTFVMADGSGALKLPAAGKYKKLTVIGSMATLGFIGNVTLTGDLSFDGVIPKSYKINSKGQREDAFFTMTGTKYDVSIKNVPYLRGAINGSVKCKDFSFHGDTGIYGGAIVGPVTGTNVTLTNIRVADVVTATDLTLAGTMNLLFGGFNVKRLISAEENTTLGITYDASKKPKVKYVIGAGGVDRENKIQVVFITDEGEQCTDIADGAKFAEITGTYAGNIEYVVLEDISAFSFKVASRKPIVRSGKTLIVMPENCQCYMETDGEPEVTYYATYEDAINEINRIADKSARYTVTLLDNAPDANAASDYYMKKLSMPAAGKYAGITIDGNAEKWTTIYVTSDLTLTGDTEITENVAICKNKTSDPDEILPISISASGAYTIEFHDFMEIQNINAAKSTVIFNKYPERSDTSVTIYGTAKVGTLSIGENVTVYIGQGGDEEGHIKETYTKASLNVGRIIGDNKRTSVLEYYYPGRGKTPKITVGSASGIMLNLVNIEGDGIDSIDNGAVLMKYTGAYTMDTVELNPSCKVDVNGDKKNAKLFRIGSGLCAYDTATQTSIKLKRDRKLIGEYIDIANVMTEIERINDSSAKYDICLNEDVTLKNMPAEGRYSEIAFAAASSSVCIITEGDLKLTGNTRFGEKIEVKQQKKGQQVPLNIVGKTKRRMYVSFDRPNTMIGNINAPNAAVGFATGKIGEEEVETCIKGSVKAFMLMAFDNGSREQKHYIDIKSSVNVTMLEGSDVIYRYPQANVSKIKAKYVGIEDSFDVELTDGGAPVTFDTNEVVLMQSDGGFYRNGVSLSNQSGYETVLEDKKIKAIKTAAVKAKYSLSAEISVDGDTNPFTIGEFLTLNDALKAVGEFTNCYQGLMDLYGNSDEEKAELSKAMARAEYTIKVLADDTIRGAIVMPKEGSYGSIELTADAERTIQTTGDLTLTGSTYIAGCVDIQKTNAKGEQVNMNIICKTKKAVEIVLDRPDMQIGNINAPKAMIQLATNVINGTVNAMMLSGSGESVITFKSSVTLMYLSGGSSVKFRYPQKNISKVKVKYPSPLFMGDCGYTVELTDDKNAPVSFGEASSVVLMTAEGGFYDNSIQVSTNNATAGSYVTVLSGKKVIAIRKAALEKGYELIDNDFTGESKGRYLTLNEALGAINGLAATVEYETGISMELAEPEYAEELKEELQEFFANTYTIKVMGDDAVTGAIVMPKEGRYGGISITSDESGMPRTITTTGDLTLTGATTFQNIHLSKVKKSGTKLVEQTLKINTGTKTGHIYNMQFKGGKLGAYTNAGKGTITVSK